MRASGPYEVKPRQLRALVLLLALLPLLPMAFVVSFVVEDVAYERLEARERARPAYQRFLEVTSASLAAGIAKSIAAGPAPGLDDPWRLVREHPAVADAVLTASTEERLSFPEKGEAGPGPPGVERFAKTILESGVHYAALPPTGPVRWRFLSETPEPIFSLHPGGNPARQTGGAPLLLLIKTRQHLQEQIAAYYQKELDPQTALRLVDETASVGESLPLVGPTDAPSTGEPLAEALLPPPLPAWRVQLYVLDSTLVTGLAREQIAFYWWAVAGMIAATAAIAGVAGWALTRRISLHELSNDALSVVSHEMKTPLASIRLLIETLLERRYRGGPEAVDEYLHLIAGENARLTRLVEDFQTLSRLDGPRGGRPRLNIESVRAEEIIETARARLAGRLEADGCDFQTEGESEAKPFAGDREVLTAVLVNLLDNALKYSGDKKKIVLQTRDARDRVTFEVSDNGIGIASEEQGRIFERFYQSDARLSRTHEGCGLGLNIVRSAVKAHRGTVSVQSTPGKGSAFTVCIPRTELGRQK